MSRLISLLLLLTLANEPVFAGEHARAALKSWLGDAISFSNTPRMIAIEYCPDNTCERLSVATRASASDLEDFAFFYLLKKSNYIYLKDRRPENEAEVVAAVSEKYQRSCSGSGTGPNVECILKRLQSRASVKLFFVRHDEGYKCVVPEALLGRAPIARSGCRREKSAA